MTDPQHNWQLIASHNSHSEEVEVGKYVAPSFETIRDGDLIKVCSMKGDFVFNPLKLEHVTRVENYDKTCLAIEQSKEYDGVVLEKTLFHNKFTQINEEIIKIMLCFNEAQRFVYINSKSCWYGGLTIYKFNSKS